MRSSFAQGFSLLELMTATLIAALLTTLAISGYRDFILRSQRTDAHLALLRVQAEQERHFLAHHHYAESLTAPPAQNGLGLGIASEHGYYDLHMQTSNEGSSFLVTAIPAGAQRQDRHCSSFSIDEIGRRDATGATDAPLRCWR